MTGVGTYSAPLSTGRPHESMGWRISVSVLTVFGLVIFLLLYFTFVAAAYAWFQNLVVLVVALLAFVGINGAAWAGWGASRRLSEPTP